MFLNKVILTRLGFRWTTLLVVLQRFERRWRFFELPSATYFFNRKKVSKILGKINSSLEQYFAGPPAPNSDCLLLEVAKVGIRR